MKHSEHIVNWLLENYKHDSAVKHIIDYMTRANYGGKEEYPTIDVTMVTIENHKDAILFEIAKHFKSCTEELQKVLLQERMNSTVPYNKL